VRPLAALYCGIVVAFLLGPVLLLVPMSLSASIVPEFPPHVLSLKQYRDFLDSGVWLTSLGTSVRIALATAATATVLGTMATFALVRGTFRGRGIASTVLLAPRFVPVIIIALGFYALFAQLHLVGNEGALILAHTIIAAPYVILVVSATLRGFDRSLERASQSLGASPFTTVLRITLPLIRPAVLGAALIAFIISFDEIVIAIFISGTRVVTLPKRMWDSLVYEMEPMLPAISTLILLTTVLVFVLAGWARRGAKRLSTHRNTLGGEVS
jgi:putative spermidine/putrescine transport system permease protein